ncbi:MAG: NMD3-related protein [archaeon]
MNRQCPKCGKEITEGQEVYNFCIDCYLKDHEVIVIPKIDLSYCVKCAKVKYAAKLYDNVEEAEKAIEKHVKIKELDSGKLSVKLNLNFEKGDYSVTVTLKALVGNKVVSIEKKERILLKKEVCQVCSRVAGNYFTTILQVRFLDKKIQEKIGNKVYNQIYDMVDSINQNGKNSAESTIHIVKEDTQKTGIDFYLDNVRLTHSIMTSLMKSQYAVDHKISNTLFGLSKEGQRTYRHTFCIHFGEKELTPKERALLQEQELEE